MLRDLSAQGTPVNIQARLTRWRCRNDQCDRRIFAERLPNIEAVRNAVLEPWSNGQTEGQINKLKTLKRAMYGRAGVDLLRARMMPLQGEILHRD